MPLAEFFEEQIDTIGQFLDQPGGHVHVVHCPPDTRPILRRLLVRLDDRQEQAHMLLTTSVAFRDPNQFAGEVLDEIAEHTESFRDELAPLGVTLPAPPAENGSPNTLARYASDCADAFPDSVGSYVILMDVEEIGDADQFRAMLAGMGETMQSPWAKVLFIDRLDDPVCPAEGELFDSEVYTTQRFHLPPEEIEQRVNRDLEGGNLPADEEAKYAAMAGSFASAHGRYDEAEAHHQRSITAAETSGDLGDQVSAYYNLGNTLLAKGDAEAAETMFVRAASISLEHEMHPMTALVLTNLGVTLHRLQRVDEAIESLSISRRTFHQLDNVPGEAYALDCLANIHGIEGDNEAAEARWRDALKLYDDMKSGAAEEIRAAGRQDILEKLDRFLRSIDEGEKADRLLAESTG